MENWTTLRTPAPPPNMPPQPVNLCIVDASIQIFAVKTEMLKKHELQAYTASYQMSLEHYPKLLQQSWYKGTTTNMHKTVLVL